MISKGDFIYMQLFRMKVQKDGKTYVDYILAWKFKDRVVHNRIVPCFNGCYKTIHSRAINIASMEELKKYDLGN